MEPNQTQQKSNGALIGSVIIIIILIIGGIYMWSKSIKQEEVLPENNALSGEEQIDNSAAAIEAELNGMDLEIDSEI
jgi:hypothetical protein